MKMPSASPIAVLFAALIIWCPGPTTGLLAATATQEITGQDGAPMMLVPGGEFLFGYDNNRLSLPAFYMDKYEVTIARYGTFLDATRLKAPYRWEEVKKLGHGELPVIGVDWYDTDAYCRFYGKRLPTEKEWEKAARGTDGRKYPWGNDAPTKRHANFDKCCEWMGYATLTVPGSFEAGKSPYGIYDLAGNVGEWTATDWDPKNKVLKGGSWYVGAPNLHAAKRYRNEPATRNFFVGFRCVQDAPKKP